MTIIEFVIANVNPDQYYAKRFPKWDSKYRLNIFCPWHEKEGVNKPSLNVGLRNGGAKCHGCGKSIGNIVHFESELNETSELTAASALYVEFIRPFFPREKVERYVANLQFEPRVQEQCIKELGLFSRTLKFFNLGYDHKLRRLVIPIRTRFNKWGNVRFYKFPSERKGHDAPKIFNATGFGYAEMYPWEQIKTYDPSKPLIWMKAERDTLLAIQDGIQAFCITGSGESVGLERWVADFKDYEIFIVGDNDPEGIKHGKKRKEGIIENCKLAKVILLPFSKKSKDLKDYSDWILKDGHTGKELLDLIASEREVAEVLESEEIVEPKLHSDKMFSLSEIRSNPTIRDVKVRTKGIVIGKLERSYSIPCKFRISRKDSPASFCEIPVSRELIWMIHANDDAIKDFVRRKFVKDKKAKIEPIDYVIATEVELAPLVDLSSEGTYLTFNGIFVGTNVETNVPYEFEIIPTTSIKTQAQVGIITSARAISSILDSQIFQKGNLASLDIFRSDNSAWDDLCTFASEISLQYTRIYNRLDWHLVALLTWLSPLHFKFPHEGLQRGWLNSLAIGDTQTGKSEVARQLQRVFDCGAVVNGENCTFVGLVGGTVKNSTGQFMLRWGRVPINDRQLVVIEELSGLSTIEIARMSEVRSSGIARIDKGGITAETTARTRLLALSNVRGMGKALASYQSGLRAIGELVGQAEDVSRFDLICTLTDSEVSSDVINQPALNYDDLGIYSLEQMRRLVRFIWSLKPDQIQLTERAYLASLQITQEMSKRYHPSVPIFKAGSGRLKLARIACAIACTLFNWDGKRIVVDERHIKAAEKLLCLLYDKPSFGYKKYSVKTFCRDTISNEEKLTEVFNKVFHKIAKRSRVINYMEQTEKFSDRELYEITGIPQIEISQFLGACIDSHIIERIGRDWKLTSIGKLWVDKTSKV